MKSTLYLGDCLVVLDMLETDSVDSCVTDPPYHLTSIVKRFGETARSDDTKTSERVRGGVDGFARMARGFMGQTWDGGDIAFRTDVWAQVLRVLKPGAHLLAFGGTRTYHRMACAIEDAGFEIRDQIGWLYGSGFPKSHNQGDGWGTALKPAWEPIVMARKPLVGTVAANRERYGTGAINIEASRVAVDPDADAMQLRTMSRTKRETAEGWGMSTTAGDTPQVVKPEGRWPANIIHDGSDEVVSAFPPAPGQQADLKETGRARPTRVAFGDMAPPRAHAARNDAGSAARFFYCAKAARSDRDENCEGLPARLGGIRSETSGQHITRRDGKAPGLVLNDHPTVKPATLMRYLCRLVTPLGGTVLDPFMGSGSTGKAALREGFGFIGIEQDAKYFEIAKRRAA